MTVHHPRGIFAFSLTWTVVYLFLLHECSSHLILYVTNNCTCPLYDRPHISTSLPNQWKIMHDLYIVFACEWNPNLYQYTTIHVLEMIIPTFIEQIFLTIFVGMSHQAKTNLFLMVSNLYITLNMHSSNRS